MLGALVSVKTNVRLKEITLLRRYLSGIPPYPAAWLRARSGSTAYYTRLLFLQYIPHVALALAPQCILFSYISGDT